MLIIGSTPESDRESILDLTAMLTTEEVIIMEIEPTTIILITYPVSWRWYAYIIQSKSLIVSQL